MFSLACAGTNKFCCTFSIQECEFELTQKGEMVSRLHAKTNQIGKLLNNLEKFNHLMKDGEGGRSPTTPGGSHKTFQSRTSPTTPMVALRPKSICDSSEAKKHVAEAQKSKPVKTSSSEKRTDGQTTEKKSETSEAAAAAD